MARCEGILLPNMLLIFGHEITNPFSYCSLLSTWSRHLVVYHILNIQEKNNTLMFDIQ